MSKYAGSPKWWIPALLVVAFVVGTCVFLGPGKPGIATTLSKRFSDFSLQPKTKKEGAEAKIIAPEDPSKEPYLLQVPITYADNTTHYLHPSRALTTHWARIGDTIAVLLPQDGTQDQWTYTTDPDMPNVLDAYLPDLQRLHRRIFTFKALRIGEFSLHFVNTTNGDSYDFLINFA